MKPQKIVDLINASQGIIKNQLLANSMNNKYDLLMIIRSFDLLKSYIQQIAHHDHSINELLENALGLPIPDTNQGLKELCQNIRNNQPPENVMALLHSINQQELKITNPKAVEHG